MVGVRPTDGTEPRRGTRPEKKVGRVSDDGETRDRTEFAIAMAHDSRGGSAETPVISKILKRKTADKKTAKNRRTETVGGLRGSQKKKKKRSKTVDGEMRVWKGEGTDHDRGILCPKNK